MKLHELDSGDCDAAHFEVRSILKSLSNFLLLVKVENILKGSLDLIPSPSVKIRIMGRKVSLRCSGAASGWAGWALAHPEFGSSVNPITTRGADYANHITARPPGFENPAASLRCKGKTFEAPRAQQRRLRCGTF